MKITSINPSNSDNYVEIHVKMKNGKNRKFLAEISVIHISMQTDWMKEHIKKSNKYVPIIDEN